MYLRKRTPFILIALTAIIGLSAAAFPEKQEEEFKGKNLKVLPKDISKDEIDVVMKSWKDALGVKCGHCHAPSATNSKKLDFASDAKPEKETARKMYKMTRNLNKKYFSGNTMAANRVSCNTCHRGAEEPQDALAAKK